MFSHCLNLRLRHLNKNAPLAQNSWNLDDLRTFEAKYCRQDLRTFFANFFTFRMYTKWMFPSLKYTDTKMQIQKYTNAGYGIPKLFAEYIQYHV